MLQSVLAAGFAAGAVLHLLLVVLVWARPLRQGTRRLDRLFLALFIALLSWHGGNLLALRLAAFEGAHGHVLLFFSRAAAFAGLSLLPPLVADLHLEYLKSWRSRAARVALYLPLTTAPWGVHAAAAATGIPRGPWTTGFILYFCAALAVSVAINIGLARRAAANLRLMHLLLAVFFAGLAGACAWAFLPLTRFEPASAAHSLEWIQYVLMLSSIVPSTIVGFWMFRFNFLEARAQQGVAVAALGLMGVLAYGLVIQRLAAAMEQAGYLPSGVTEALLVFALVVMIEPASRRVRRWLTAQVSSELARIEELRGELHDRAMAASPSDLRHFAAERAALFFGFPVLVDPSGTMSAEGGRELTAREQGTLRLLSAHTVEAIERSRLVAERLRLERELAERQKLAALGEMVAFIAHRLKNPLSAINTLVQVIAEQSPQAAGHCDVIRGEIRRLNTAVGDVLRFTRAPGETAPGTAAATRHDEVPAEDVLGEVARLFKPDAEQRGVLLDVQPGTAALPISRESLLDALTSLVGNALDAAPAGTRVLLFAERRERHTLVAVEDEGPGVPPADCDRVFEPFVTTKPGGTGLGLALARRRAREAGGDIRCVSPARGGRGARFEIIFPF